MFKEKGRAVIFDFSNSTKLRFSHRRISIDLNMFLEIYLVMLTYEESDFFH